MRKTLPSTLACPSAIPAAAARLVNPPTDACPSALPAAALLVLETPITDAWPSASPPLAGVADRISVWKFSQVSDALCGVGIEMLSAAVPDVETSSHAPVPAPKTPVGNPAAAAAAVYFAGVGSGEVSPRSMKLNTRLLFAVVVRPVQVTLVLVPRLWLDAPIGDD